MPCRLEARSYQISDQVGDQLTENSNTHSLCDLGAGGIECIIYIKERDEPII